MDISTHLFGDDGDVPNHPRYPLIVYASAADPASSDMAAAFETLFHGHGWLWSWRNGIYPFHHYHSNNHEVLGIATGMAEVRFGGEKGVTLSVRAGDAVLIPAGVGHKRLSGSPDLLVIGAYPTSTPVDLHRRGAEGGQRIRARIGALDRPATDPVGGEAGPMAVHWLD